MVFFIPRLSFCTWQKRGLSADKCLHLKGHFKPFWRSIKSYIGWTELLLLSLVHDEWNIELSCRIMFCSAGIGKVWPGAESGLQPVFCKFYRNTATTIHLHIVCGCFQAITAKMNNCERDLLSGPSHTQKNFAKPCSGGMCF